MKKSIMSFLLLMITTLSFAKTELIPICYQNKFGFIDKDFEVKIPIVYKSFCFSNDMEYIVCSRDENNGIVYEILDKTGFVVFQQDNIWGDITPIFGEFFYFLSPNENGLPPYHLYNAKEKKEIIIQDGYEIYPVQDTESKSDFFAVRSKNGGKYVSLDGSKTLSFDVLNDNSLVFPIIDGVGVIANGKKVFDINGNIIKTDLIDSGMNYSQGVLPVISKTDSGFIDKKGNYIFKCKIYREPSGGGLCPGLSCSFKEDVACVPVSENEWCVYDKAGKILFQTNEYKLAANTFSEGKICVYKKTPNGNVYSFLDKKGKQFSKYIFEKATSFYNGYAMVILEGKDALLDSAGKIIYVSDILNK